MDKKQYLDQSAYVAASTYRSRVLQSLYGHGDTEVYKTPTQISRETGIRTNHISNVLVDLKKHQYIECVNEHRRKNRLYCLTDYGKDICNFISDKRILLL